MNPNSTPSRLSRLLKWTVTNGVMAWSAWAAVNGNAGAGRLLVFLSWLFLIMTVISSHEKHRAKIHEMGRSVPAWMAHTLEFVMIGFLVWHGWWVTAITHMIMALLAASIFEPNKDAHATDEASTKEAA